MKETTKTVRICDNDHVFIDGKQYISLTRFTELTQKNSLELDMLQREVEVLSVENKALRVLLKKQLEEEG